jgi:hypothetical protein
MTRAEAISTSTIDPYASTTLCGRHAVPHHGIDDGGHVRVIATIRLNVGGDVTRRPRPIQVAGEAVADLLPGLVALRDSMQLEEDGMTSMRAHLSPRDAAPLARALFRVEAELLQRDARVWDELARTRSADNRRADAFLLLVQRVGRAARQNDRHG